MYRFVVYKDVAGHYRWRLWSNSRVIADSGQGYKQIKSVLRVFDTLACQLLKADKWVIKVHQSAKEAFQQHLKSNTHTLLGYKIKY